MGSRCGRTALYTAVGGLLAGLGGCAEPPQPRVPGAPAVDPAGVPAARAAEPKPTGGEKMSCSGKMSCNGTKMDESKHDPQRPANMPPSG